MGRVTEWCLVVTTLLLSSDRVNSALITQLPSDVIGLLAEWLGWHDWCHLAGQCNRTLRRMANLVDYQRYHCDDHTIPLINTHDDWIFGFWRYSAEKNKRECQIRATMMNELMNPLNKRVLLFTDNGFAQLRSVDHSVHPGYVQRWRFIPAHYSSESLKSHLSMHQTRQLLCNDHQSYHDVCFFDAHYLVGLSFEFEIKNIKKNRLIQMDLLNVNRRGMIHIIQEISQPINDALLAYCVIPSNHHGCDSSPLLLFRYVSQISECISESMLINTIQIHNYDLMSNQHICNPVTIQLPCIHTDVSFCNNNHNNNNHDYFMQFSQDGSSLLICVINQHRYALVTIDCDTGMILNQCSLIGRPINIHASPNLKYAMVLSSLDHHHYCGGDLQSENHLYDLHLCSLMIPSHPSRFECSFSKWLSDELFISHDWDIFGSSDIFPATLLISVRNPRKVITVIPRKWFDRIIPLTDSVSLFEKNHRTRMVQWVSH